MKNMKKKYPFFITLVLFLSLFTNANAQRKDGRILFTAKLNGYNEVPEVVTKAKGLVTFMLEENGTLIINGVFDSLSGPVTGCHLHNANFISNGPVVQNLTTNVKGNRLYAEILNAPKSLITNIVANQIYINVHTTANPNGEIRGQLELETDSYWQSSLSGFDEVPVAPVFAEGLVSLVVSKNTKTLDYKAVVDKLTGPVTGAHLHFGKSGKNGAIAYPLNVNGNLIEGKLEISPAFYDSLRYFQAYINVHTTAYPNGELRAQLTLFNSYLSVEALVDGSQEVPAVTTTAKALMTAILDASLDTLTCFLLYNGLSPTMVHIHDGAKGANGGVLFTLQKTITTSNVYTGKFVLTPALRAKLLKGEMYINVHTAANPNGEIRGQLYSSIREGMVANLCSGQEVAANTSTAIGAAAISVNRNKTDVSVELVTNGLTGNASAGHIHKGLKGANGAVYVGFSNILGNMHSGIYTLPTTGGGDSIVDGQTYVNVHTTANTGGEIRGQIGKTLETQCVPVGIFELNGQQLTVKIAPNPMTESVNVSFDAPSDLSGQLIVRDLLGRPIISKNVDILRGPNQIGLGVSELANGVYFVQLRSKNQLLFV
jgi:CHRD domain/Secretion system C-terminal sorting domain